MDNEQAIEEASGLFQANPELFEEEMIGGVIFPNEFDYRDDMSTPSMKYSLRMNPRFASISTDLLFPVFQLSGPGFARNKVHHF